MCVGRSVDAVYKLVWFKHQNYVRRIFSNGHDTQPYVNLLSSILSYSIRLIPFVPVVCVPASAKPKFNHSQ